MAEMPLWPIKIKHKIADKRGARHATSEDTLSLQKGCAGIGTSEDTLFSFTNPTIFHQIVATVARQLNLVATTPSQSTNLTSLNLSPKSQ